VVGDIPADVDCVVIIGIVVAGGRLGASTTGGTPITSSIPFTTANSEATFKE